MVRFCVRLMMLFCTACATYQIYAKSALQSFYSGDYTKAADILEPKSKEENKDQLLFLFDRGMALQLAGRYKESEKNWIDADQMSEVKDYTSLSAEAAS